MNNIVHAVMHGMKAPAHLTIGGIYNYIYFQCSNISLPQIDSSVRLYRRKLRDIRNPGFPVLLPQIFVLNR